MIGIYKITNPIDRIYIGQSVNIKKRFNDYKFLDCKYQRKLYNSLNKYGYINHTFEILEECDIEQLNERERYYQDLYNCVNKGLNCRLTTTDDKSGKLSEKTKLKIRNVNLGNIHLEKTKLKIKNSITEYFKLNNHHNSKKVINIETGEIYESCSELARILNINQSTLSRQLNGYRKQNKTKYKYK
jgi:group I intron endonuclease